MERGERGREGGGRQALPPHCTPVFGFCERALSLLFFSRTRHTFPHHGQDHAPVRERRRGQRPPGFYTRRELGCARACAGAPGRRVVGEGRAAAAPTIGGEGQAPGPRPRPWPRPGAVSAPGTLQKGRLVHTHTRWHGRARRRRPPPAGGSWPPSKGKGQCRRPAHGEDRRAASTPARACTDALPPLPPPVTQPPRPGLRPGVPPVS